MNDSLPGLIDYYLNINSSLQGEINYDLNINDSLQGEINYGVGWVWWSNPLRGLIDYGIANFFPGLKSNIPLTRTEKDARYFVTAYIQLPELGTVLEIPSSLFLAPWLEQEFNGPIRGGFSLNNVDCRFTKGTGDYAGLLRDKIWAYSRETRQYIKFVERIIIGDNEYINYYPRLVIYGRTGGIELNFEIMDEISFLLGQDLDIASYVAREILTRESDTEFYAIELSNHFNRLKNSELLNNCSQVTDSEFIYTSATKKYELSFRYLFFRKESIRCYF